MTYVIFAVNQESRSGYINEKGNIDHFDRAMEFDSKEDAARNLELAYILLGYIGQVVGYESKVAGGRSHNKR